jgi:PKD repeat protein
VNGTGNELPHAVISVDGKSIVNGRITVEPGELLQFRGSSSSDSDGTIQSYQWNFDDGSTAQVPDPTHAFQNAGTYTVTLTVTDNDSGRDTESLIVQMIPDCQNANWDFRQFPVGTTLSCTVNLDLTDASSATLSYTAEDIDDPAEATWHVNQGNPQNASSTGDGQTGDFSVPIALGDLQQDQNTVSFTFTSDLNGSTTGFSVWNIDISLDSGGSLDRSGKVWEPVEWSLENTTYSGNPFDLDATVTFTHTASGESRRTGIFYDGNNMWKFRFTGTRTGSWTFTTSSSDPDLNGKSGTVTVEPNPGVPGFMTKFGDKWGRLGLDEAFVPQYVMYGGPTYFYNNPGRIDADIQTFLVEHGFTGFHVLVFCRWFDINQPTNVNLPSDPNPDPRTFEALEMLITKVHEAGGVVHFWMWGDDERDQTPVRWGKNGTVDKRLQRYIAARLGPLPGWSMSYGFDLDEWVVEDDLQEWHIYMQQHFGWSHFLGARDPGPNSPSEPFNQIYEGLDYSSYEQHKPDYNRYVETLEARPNKPSFSEDRFRMRNEGRAKDYNMEETRRGLWHSTMAGGVANIWGNLLSGGDISASYPNPEQIRTYATFFEDRFRKDMFRCNTLTDGVCLQQPDNAHFIFYKEDTDSIQLDLSGMAGVQAAVAVDTKNDYLEINLGTLNVSDQTWNAPYTSDWAIAVGDFSGSVVTCDGDLNEDGQINDQDLQLMADAILAGNPNGLCADLNDDRVIDAIDLQTLVNRILGQ